MTEPMTIYRLEVLSVNYFIKNLFTENEFISVVNEFPKTIMNVPTLSIVSGKLVEDFIELGNSNKPLRTRRYFIDIFGKNLSQTDDFAYRILQNLNRGINVYDYNEGFPPDASPTRINHLSVVRQSYEPLDVIPKVNEKLYYRGQLIIVTQNDLV